ncbi:MAG: hypothetical protein ACK4MS_09045 [Paracoccaceae bacterium]
MLWDIRTLLRPALSVIDLIPNIHRTPALAALRRAVLEGWPATLRLSDEDRELAFHDAHVQLTSPIGARVLRILYDTGTLKLKKPPAKSLPALEAYIATEPAFRADVARIIAADDARRARLTAIIADPGCARADEITPALIDKVISAHLGHTAIGSMEIGGTLCHRSLAPEGASDRTRGEDKFLCWWTDSTGQQRGDPN